MTGITDALAATTAAITAMAALGAASYGLVDATKTFGGGVSNVGLGSLTKALAPFQPALNNANARWQDTIRANWLNGVAKEDQKATAKSLVRLGLSSNNAADLATAGHVDAAALATALTNIETGAALTTADAQVLGRLNAAIDATMDAGFERADQQYRNTSRLVAGVFAIGLSIWAGYLLGAHGGVEGLTPQNFFWPSFFVGLVSVPIAPVAKDLASSLQAAASAVKAVKG
jgi:hypothetical protein